MAKVTEKKQNEINNLESKLEIANSKIMSLTFNVQNFEGIITFS